MDCSVLLLGFTESSQTYKHNDLTSLMAISNMFNLLGHWFFATQYLKTCLILPKLLIEAKLEWVLGDSEEQAKNQVGQPMNVNRLVDALNE